MKASVNIRLMETDFQLSCDEDEKIILETSANFLNNELRNFKKNNPTLDRDKLMLMGSLHCVTQLVSMIKESDNNSQIANQNILETLTELDKV